MQDLSTANQLPWAQDLREGGRHGAFYVSRILEWPAPKNQGELKSFLGFTAYYKEFLPGYSQLTNRMNAMRGKNSEFKWDKQVQTDFEAVKKEFSREQLRAYPDFNKEAEPFQVTTDWSATNITGQPFYHKFKVGRRGL